MEEGVEELLNAWFGRVKAVFSGARLKTLMKIPVHKRRLLLHCCGIAHLVSMAV